MSRHVVVMGAGETLLCSAESRELVLSVMRQMVRLADIAPSPLAKDVMAALEEARRRSFATAAPAVAEVPQRAGAAPSLLDDLVDTTEVARMIGSGPRNARDLCARGAFASAVRLGGAWRVSRAEVTAYVTGRSAA